MTCCGVSQAVTLWGFLFDSQPFVTMEQLQECLGLDVASTLRTVLPFSTNQEGLEVFNFEEYLAGSEEASAPAVEST